MQRWFRLSSLLLVLTAAFNIAQAAYVEVRGSLPPGAVRVFVRDTVYRISGTYTIGGTLLIEPGTTVEFMPNGRLVDSAGGRIIADGRASATYNPTAVNPLVPPYTGYDDLSYFGAAGVVTSTIATEPTIHTSKYSTIFNVNLGTNVNLQGLTPAQAIMYKASRLELGSVISAIRLNAWFRPTGASINVAPARITFKAGDVNTFSREWGHIVVLPGARAAFFRDVDFVNFRKDTTVDNRPVYLTNNNGQAFTPAQAETANAGLLDATNGGGGAITTFSSRTWIVGCNFRNNMSRFRGGAVQILQAPSDTYSGTALQLYPQVSTGFLSALPKYPATVNPFMTDPTTGNPISSNLPITDYIYDANPETMSDVDRQAIDDARLALYLGRIRQSRFTGNHVLLSDVDTVRVGGIRIVTDADRPATVFANTTRSQKNEAFGGAIYVSGRTPMVVGVGVNDFQGKDTMEFNSNFVVNRQPATPNGNSVSQGARGGAVYVGNQTSVIFAGRYTTNKTETPYITTLASTGAASVGNFSKGGAIYASTGAWQIQVRGNLDNNPPTHFLGNSSGRGGAIFVENGTNDNSVSPWIGGSDGIINARNYGFNIKFRDNRASVDGGAVYTARNMYMYGAGGASGPLWIYGTNYGVEFQNNTANFSGGAISVQIPQNLPIERRTLRFVRGHFLNNRVGQVASNLASEVRGGGALYTINADLNVVKGVEFRANKVWNGNGGAIAVVTPDTLTRKRFMVTDMDQITFDANGTATGYNPRNDIFTFQTASPRPDERMLTRFYENEAYANSDRQGSGATQRGDVKLTHPGTTLRENGTGLGGALYILDSVRLRVDTFSFDRVRMQNNVAFSGAGMYSDNYDLKLAMARCLVTGNKATSTIGRSQDVVDGPLVGSTNPASSDLAGAVLFGEVTGPLPWKTYSYASNSIYDNDARYIIRLPDAQDTKGVLAGTTGIGFGGVDTLRGNYWGRTEANVNTILPNTPNTSSFGRIQETFFIAGNGKTHMRFVRNSTANATEQGPFESDWRYTYAPIAIGVIPDTLLLEGRIYDIFDKGTDIKTADYSNRRMSPIEDFAVGIPPTLKLYNDPAQPSYDKYVKRMTRNPFDADVHTDIAAVQTEFIGNHPIGYPVFLEARVDYSGTAEISNNDARSYNESVFFVINERTGDYIRVNMKQKTLTDSIFRSRVELVPDSSNGGDPNIRRAYEGLATYGTGATLLSFLVDNAVAEDSSALQGRRWEGSTQLGELGGPNFRLGNRPALPVSNGGSETYYGGERYRSLPVRDGDQVTIVSRTILWKDGVVDALKGALSFTVGNNTNPPVFTGAADTLPTSPLLHPEYRNRVFVTENRLYTPITAAQSPRGGGQPSWFNEPPSYPSDINNQPIPGRDLYERDSIFSITAVDINKFYDPRVVRDPGANAQLSYFWDIKTGNSGLRYWLRDTLIRANATNNNPSWSATGYRMFRGRPINPYIVPGGELVEVVAKNFPPSVELVDSLRKNNWSEADIARWVYIYPSYFHAEEYDNNSIAKDQQNPSNTNARYLQQDTVNFGWLDSTSYQFRIHVVDSMPRFVWRHNATGAQAVTYQNMLRGDVTIVLDPTTTDPDAYDAATGTYRDTLRFTTTTSRVGRKFVDTRTNPNNILNEEYNNPAVNYNDSLNIHFVANLTDSLRFKADINTDDEFEDAASVDQNRAVVKKYGAWDFRYGKTAYGFVSTAVRETPSETSLDDIIQARPSWMATRYMRRYNGPGTQDQFAEDFTTKGQIDIRIDRANAIELLKPVNDFDPGNPINGDLNVDTTMSVIVNDGHGGVNTLTRRLFVNVQPRLLDANLEDAIEDIDYNVQLTDSSRRIKVYDPNFGQVQNFELIYVGEQRDSVPVDPYFLEAGQIVFDASRKTTPNWLKINPTSGLLYGKPTVTDLPYSDTTVNVTVLVTDAGGLRDIKTYTLNVRAVNHKPDLLQSPEIVCVEAGKEYSSKIRVTDLDLKRTQAGNEELTFAVLEPAGSWTFAPAKLASPIADTQQVTVSTSNLQGTIENGRIRIRIEVTDRQGEKDTLVYSVAVSAQTRFTADIRIENAIGGWQTLAFGVSGTEIATRGDEAATFGRLDSNYCEYELPPVPFIDVFDARWTIPTRNGIIRNIHPYSNTPGESIFQGRFQAGGENGVSSSYYPVKLSWCRTQIPARDAQNPGSYYIRDDQSNGNLFAYNMKTGEGRSIAAVQHRVSASNDCDTLVITSTAIEGFIIVYDFTTDVENGDETPSTLAITSTAPNPFATSTFVNFSVPTTSKVSVEIYDAIGNRVVTLANDVYNAGMHQVEWNGAANGVVLPNGIYTVRISDGVNTTSQQIAIVR